MNHFAPKYRTVRESVVQGKDVESFTDPELFGLLFTGKNGEDKAREALCKAGGIKPLLHASPYQLKSWGMTDAVIARIASLRVLCGRYLAAELSKGEKLLDPTKAGKYIMAQLQHLDHEVFSCLFLDNRHRVIAFEKMFQGTIDGAAVYPREVLKRCLHHNAAAVIFAHNHPSGEPDPSTADKLITEQLKTALGIVEIRVLDHLVIGDGRFISMASQGLV